MDVLAHGYRPQNGSWKEEAILGDGSYGAMGGLMTSLEDFAKYMTLYMGAWPPRSGNPEPTLLIQKLTMRERQKAN